MKLTLDNLHMYANEVGDCLMWAQGVHCCGFPQARIGNKTLMVKRYIFTELLGKEVKPGCVVTSKCGEKLCIRPDHIQQASKGAVLRRAYRDQRRSVEREYAARVRVCPHRKFTLEQVNSIRAEYLGGGISMNKLAERYGVAHSTIKNIVAWKSWRFDMLDQVLSSRSQFYA